AHGQSDTHYMQLCRKQVVPVLIGTSIPRPDGSTEDYEMYCQAMLMLFRPWRTLTELEISNATWAETFAQQTFTSDLCKIIRNMNVENECKDA
ncbi:hypothetical protein F4604DRAFT_1581861, partial [Suillus subluteus]